MNRYAEINFYDLLEVSSTGTSGDIRRAYEMAKKTYGEDSLATYSLFDPGSQKQIMDKIEEAFRVLGDEKRRHEYDIQIGLNLQNSERDRPSRTDSVPMDTQMKEKPSQRKTDSDSGTEGQKPRPTVKITEEEVCGARLKDLRESQGIPLQEIAESTRINITYLDFIEQDKFKSLPAEVFLKGYLGQYARLLGVDPSAVTEGYLRLLREWKKKEGVVED